jgi:xanthine dehydrogenase accessory factor
MFDEYYNKLESLRKQNEYFVEATVVRREIPSSGKSGDKAIIDRHGEMTGWVGGGCVKGIILKEAEAAMKTGTSRLVRVGKFSSDNREECVIEYEMECMSEGAVEIFVNPVLPTPHLVVIGKTFIAKALVKIAKAAGYRISLVAPGADMKAFEEVNQFTTQLSFNEIKISAVSAIVACTQGENDKMALELILSQPCFYKGFVASHKKITGLFNELLQQGFHREQLDVIHSPCGLNIHAKKPEEVAISILAQIIQQQNSNTGTGFTSFEPAADAASPQKKYYINPVCGMPVDIDKPKHIIEYNTEKVYFCCDGCKTQFEKEPEKYMKAGLKSNA